MENANNLLFRSSGIGQIMPGPREKVGQLQQTTINHLVDVFISAKYDRREEKSNKFLEKGNYREQDAITLYSRLTKRLFKKNNTRLNNGFITGEPDFFIGESVDKAEETFDTKCSFSLHTFLRSKMDEINWDYEWQGQAYMALTGAQQHTIIYALVNSPAHIIEDEKRRLAWKMGLLDPSGNTEYKEKAQQIERNHIFDINAFCHENGNNLESDIYTVFNGEKTVFSWEYDIPMADRIHTKIIKRDEAKIQAIYDRVIVCRNWMNENLFNQK